MPFASCEPKESSGGLTSTERALAAIDEMETPHAACKEEWQLFSVG